MGETTINQFAFDVAHLLDNDQRQRLHVYGVPDVSNALRSGEIGGLVFGRFSYGVRTDVIPSLVEQGWERHHQMPAGDVWIAPRSP